MCIRYFTVTCIRKALRRPSIVGRAAVAGANAGMQGLRPPCDSFNCFTGHHVSVLEIWMSS